MLLLGLVALTGLASGVYPAYYLASFRVVRHYAPSPVGRVLFDVKDRLPGSHLYPNFTVGKFQAEHCPTHVRPVFATGLFTDNRYIFKARGNGRKVSTGRIVSAVCKKVDPASRGNVGGLDES